MKKITLFHDHVFTRVGGNYYSPGKITYSNMKFYLSLCSSLTVVGRVVDSDCLSDRLEVSTGDGMAVVGLPNLSSPKGVISRAYVKREVADLIKNSDRIIVRLPSEIGLMALWEARKLKVPVLVEVVASAYDCLYYRGDFLAKLYAPILEYRMRKAIRSADYVLYVTSKFLQRKYPSEGVVEAVSDVSLNEFMAPRLELTFEDEIKVGVIANPDLELKGIVYAVDAVEKLRDSGLNFVLEVVGGVSERFDRPFVRMQGVVVDRESIFSWLDSLDVYVQPSLTEGLPRSLLEAMSRAVPSVATRVGGMTELLDADCLFEKGDSEGIASILHRLVSDREFYQRCSLNSLNMAKRFKSSDLLKKRLNFYHRFLDRNGEGAG